MYSCIAKWVARGVIVKLHIINQAAVHDDVLQLTPGHGFI